MNPDRFKDQVAIVTGGGSGIGRAVAARLSAEGARVSVWDLDPAALADLPVADRRLVDQADPGAVRAAADAVGAQFGRIDALIVSAGITGPNLALESYPAEDWRRVIDVNLHGTFHCNQAVIAPMRRHGYGRIVNVSSIAGKEGNPNASAYSAAKAAVIGLTKSLGKELATSGITVNAVTPAAVRTPIFEQMSESHIAFMLSKIPMGRFGTVDEIASLICWLASPEASFATGAVFDCSGGRATY